VRARAPEGERGGEQAGPADALARVVPADLRELLRAHALELQRPVWGRRHGRHRSARAGIGLDFRDHRAYSPGDDPRQLDWRAVARRDRLVLRQTEAEDELPLALVLDAAAGMDYGEGSSSKIAVARAIAGALAWLAARQGDRVGLAIGRDDGVDARVLVPHGGQERLDAVAHALARAEPRGSCPWEPLLTQVAHRLPRRSLVLVLSDLLDPGRGRDDGDAVQDELLRALAQLRARRHDVVVVQVLHDDELEFPWLDRKSVRFEDLRRVRDDVEGPGAAMRDGYLRRLRAHLDALDTGCEARGIVLVRVVTDEPLPRMFVELLARLAGVPVEDRARVQR
jgi:uncharacterized protein (DUF58 family)